MQFALVDGIRTEAAPKLKGVCQGCGDPLIPKCGNIRIRHWAHKGRRTCDPWWEESEWHLAWKSKFPTEWREFLQRADNGEKHIADVRTPDGRVIEFQNSPLKDEERNAREAFYKSIVWVINGSVRKRDLNKFKIVTQRMLENPRGSSGWKECALLRDWVGRSVDVFFDFGESDLWHLHPSTNGAVILTRVDVSSFVETIHNGAPFWGVQVRAPVVPAPIAQTTSPVWRPHLRYRSRRL